MILAPAQLFAQQRTTCDVATAIDSARVAIEQASAALRFTGSSSEYQELFFDKDNNAYLQKRSADFVRRDISLALLNTRTCERENIVVTRELLSNLAGQQMRGSKGRIVAGPVYERVNRYTRYIWWRVDYKDGVDGWTAEHLLRLTSDDTSTGNGFSQNDSISVHVPKVNVRAFPGLKRFAALETHDPRFAVALEERVRGATWNGYNTPYAIYPQEWIVIANGWRLHSQNEFIIYTPFSTPLYTADPSLAERGSAHLLNDIALAHAELARDSVMSQAVDTMTVANLTRQFMDEFYRIAIIEQTDPMAFVAYRDSSYAYSPFKRVLHIIGTNGSFAYNPVKSWVGAAGLMQIYICSRIRSDYPQANLPHHCGSSYDQSRHGHIASIKAAMLHFDLEIRYLINALGDSILDDPELPRLLMAGYNGDIARVARAYRAFGSNWYKYQGRRYLPHETVTYVMLYDYLRKHPEEIYFSY